MARQSINEYLNIIAAIGVIVGLGFVAYELRQTNAIAFEEYHASMTDKLTQFYASLYGTDASDILAKAHEEEALTRAEALKLQGILAAWVEVYQYGHALQQTGRTNENWVEFMAYEAPMLLGNKHSKVWWEWAKGTYPTELVEAVDHGLANAGPGAALQLLDEMRFGREAQP